MYQLYLEIYGMEAGVSNPRGGLTQTYFVSDTFSISSNLLGMDTHGRHFSEHEARIHNGKAH